MYESSINQVMSKISSEMKECEDNQLMCKIRQTIGYDIDKTELVRALRYDRQQYEKGYADGLNANRWIPVAERLPEEAFGCLVTVEEDDIYGEPHRVIYPDFVGYDGKTWNDADGETIPFEVIAWMPLPQPYKSESEDKGDE